jgi:hypothetical protein
MTLNNELQALLEPASHQQSQAPQVGPVLVLLRQADM